MLRRQAELLHAVGELVLHGVGDEPGDRVLADVADHVRTLARRQLEDAGPVEEQVAAEVAAGEAGHQPGDHAEQGRLARPGRTGHEHQLAVADREVDVAEDAAVRRRRR